MCRVVVRCGASAPSLVPIRGQCVAVSPGDILWHLVTSGDIWWQFEVLNHGIWKRSRVTRVTCVTRVTRVRVWPCLDHVSMLRCASLCSSGASFPPAEIACPSSKPSGLRWLPTQSTQNIWARVSSKMSSEMHDILRNWMTSSVTKKNDSDKEHQGTAIGGLRGQWWNELIAPETVPVGACWGLWDPWGPWGPGPGLQWS